MNLSEFLTRLLTDGLVLVPRHMAVFQEDDLQASTLLLKQLYDTDCHEMPSQAPAFEPEAALWAARYLFYATQLVLLRDQDEAAMDQYLQPFPGRQSADVIYSVDLIFRYLGNLLKLSSGIAPNDPLVIYLRQTAAQWPFSSVGLSIEPATDTAVIFEHPSLKYTYVDRIILRTDVSRLNGVNEQQTLKEILGIHQAKLWPALELPALPHQQTL